jgi:hypothetical protein
MQHPTEDKSMFLFRIGGGELASREIAVRLAEIIIESICGEGEFAAQHPLKITETPATWVIEGSKPYDYSQAEDQLILGRVTIEIEKANCRVLQFSRYADFAP